MKIDIMDIRENDTVMIHHCIGSISSQKVDKHCKPILKALVDLFGKGRVILFPVREGPTWDFTIVRKPVVPKKLRRNAL